MNVGALNLAAIVKAIEHHNATCTRGRAVAVELHSIEIERLGWDDGDQLAGCELRANDNVQTGVGRVICAADDTKGQASEDRVEIRHGEPALA